MKRPSLDDMGPGTDRPVPARAEREAPGTRVRKPTLEEMSSAASRPIPARDRREAPSTRPGAAASSAPAEPAGGDSRRAVGVSEIDPRTKAGAYGENIRGPHKPTYDEMGPHAERGLPTDGPRPAKPTRTVDISGDATKKKPRHGRPRKTGRPGA